MYTNSNLTYYKDKLLETLHSELEIHESYENWLNELSGFHNCLKKYINITNEKNFYGGGVLPKETILKSGHVLDHHVLGYFAPLNFKRIGFDTIQRTPSEQIFLLSEQLRKHNIRFIYVPLPCKLAVYPEMVFDEIGTIKDRKVIPQWRKMLKELLDMNVEVVDVYDDFLKNKLVKNLYSKSHNISPFGAEIIANKISDYIKNTTDFSYFSKFDLQLSKKLSYIYQPVSYSGEAGNGYPKFIEINEMEASQIFFKEEKILKPYLSNKYKSEIITIGNCNLQSYLYSGADITSNLSYELSYPVEYGGRYLPFCSYDRLNRMPAGLLFGKKILIYVSFPSDSFVRSRYMPLLWNLENIPEHVFNKI